MVLGDYDSTLEALECYLIATLNVTTLDWKERDDMDFEKFRRALKTAYSYFFPLYTSFCDANPDEDYYCTDWWWKDIYTVLEPMRGIDEYRSNCSETIPSKEQVAQKLVQYWNTTDIMVKKEKRLVTKGDYGSDSKIDPIWIESAKSFHGAAVKTYFSILQSYLGVESAADVVALVNLIAYDSLRDTVFGHDLLANGTDWPCSLDMPAVALPNSEVQTKLLSLLQLSTTPSFKCPTVEGFEGGDLNGWNGSDCWKRVISDKGICHITALGMQLFEHWT